MEPQLSGFALGLLFGAAKIGFIGTIGFGIAWWRAKRRLRRYEDGLPAPGRLEERLGSLEQASEYTTAKLAELVEAQTALVQLMRTSPSPPRLQVPLSHPDGNSSPSHNPSRDRGPV